MKRYNLINNSLGWLCFLIAAVTYLLTLEPTASFWDCPEFISQGTKLDIGHPPGNPIFMLTARFFVTIFGTANAALAVNTMSALLSAATILLLFWTITHLARKLVVRDGSQEISTTQMIIIMGAGLCGALLYTWSDTFWFSAVEAEVYAFSSFCTALVFWLILKWENRADEPHSDRYLVLLAYVIGVSIAVHLLNLLCIPAIVLVFYYRKFKNVNAKGSLIALGVSVVLIAAILYGLVPGFIKVAQGFELFFVNVVGMGYNSGALIYAIVVLAVYGLTIRALYRQHDSAEIKIWMFLAIVLSGLPFATDYKVLWFILVAALGIYLFVFCRKLPVRVFNVIILSIFVIFIGYSSYALLLIRASANTPMNQNAPDNVFALSSYLNREQYGQRPLFSGPVFADVVDVAMARDYDEEGNETYVPYVIFDEKGNLITKSVDTYERDEEGNVVDNGGPTYYKAYDGSGYVEAGWTPDYGTDPNFNMLFTRIYSSDPEHIKNYKSWLGYHNEDLEGLKSRVPPEVYATWMEQGYAPYYEVSHYLPNAQMINYYDRDEIDPYTGRQGTRVDRLGWKASFTDNLKYFFLYQLNHMYWRYFMWNFAGRQNDIQGNGEPHLGNWISGIPLIDNALYGDQSLLPDEFGKGNKGHNVFYMMPLILGLIGLFWQALGKHRFAPNRGIEQFWVIFFLFFMTGVAIVLYLNQTPGQPRERDYAFAGSFYAFSIWIGLGVPAIYSLIMSAVKRMTKRKATKEVPEDTSSNKSSLAIAIVAAVIGLIVPLQMVSQTWDDHDRSHRYTTRDFGENYLYSLDDNAIIFTNGDNDTFPLWYAQEVEGVRPDVRVVNLSYLGTDWYAKQLLHPYYTAGAVDMLAKPEDVSYEALAYSFGVPRQRIPAPHSENFPSIEAYQAMLDTINWANRGLSEDNPIPALEGLQRFYETPPLREDDSMPYHILQTPYMYAPVDRQAAMKAFGVTPNDEAAYYIEDIPINALRGGFSQSTLLSVDILANSVANGFKRPVYFATTVPNRYYLGLEPYMRNTGLAKQVTPFKGEPSSVLADKAYENIVAHYKWGGLDDKRHNKGLYLDETVRRMVSTVRSSMIDVADDLLRSPYEPASAFAVKWAKDHSLAVPTDHADMARYLLNLMEEKLPASVTPYESWTDIQLIRSYLMLWSITDNADDLKRAQQLINESFDRYAQHIKYVKTLSNSRLSTIGNAERGVLRFLPLLIQMQSYIELRQQLMEHPWENAGYLAALDSTIDDFDTYYTPLLVYLTDISSDELYQQAQHNYEMAPSLEKAADILSIYEDLGLDPMEVTTRIVNKYNLTIEDLNRFFN